MTPALLTPGAVLLAAWRDVYRDGAAGLEPASYARIEASARAVSAIIARGEPVRSGRALSATRET